MWCCIVYAWRVLCGEILVWFGHFYWLVYVVWPSVILCCVLWCCSVDSGVARGVVMLFVLVCCLVVRSVVQYGVLCGTVRFRCHMCCLVWCKVWRGA